MFWGRFCTMAVERGHKTLALYSRRRFLNLGPQLLNADVTQHPIYTTSFLPQNLGDSVIRVGWTWPSLLQGLSIRLCCVLAMSHFWHSITTSLDKRKLFQTLSANQNSGFIGQAASFIASVLDCNQWDINSSPSNLSSCFCCQLSHVFLKSQTSMHTQAVYCLVNQLSTNSIPYINKTIQLEEIHSSG